MKKIILLAIVFIIGFSAQSQTAEDSVKKVVNNVFDAMRNADAALLNSCYTDSAILQTIIDKNGSIEVKNESLKGFLDFVSTVPKNDADERITFDVVKIDGPLAIVWAPYRFYYKGNFMHCGVDSFQLVRINGKWKIQYLVDTRNKNGCN